MPTVCDAKPSLQTTVKQWDHFMINIGSGNGLSPGRRKAITWTNADF